MVWGDHMNSKEMTKFSTVGYTVSTLVMLLLCLTSVEALAGQGLCGDGILQPGELCDDGNNVDGDGCTRLCDIEAGYQCTNPFVQLVPSGIIKNGGFEFGPNVSWENASPAEPVICTVDECASQPAGARNGTHWAQLGGLPEQSWALLQYPDFTSDARFLKFDAMHYTCPPEPNSNDVFAITINGNAVFFSGASSPACTNGQRYVSYTIDLDNASGGPYADSGEVEFALQLLTSAGDLTMAIDNIEVGKLANAPVPSICTLEPNVLLFEPFEDINGELGAPDFQQVVLGELGLKWGTTSDGICGSAQNPPGNHTGEPGDAACIDSTFLSPAQEEPEPETRQLANLVETYVCNAPVDLSFKLQSRLQLVVNYQPGPTSSQDFFGVWVGPTPFFGPLSTGTGSARLLVNNPQGVFGESPGLAYEFDISDQDGQPQVYVCFGYGNEGAGYAQVDTVILSHDACTDDFEEDKILSCQDNCIGVINPSQRDSDNDGYGNACDGDIAKNATPALAKDPDNNRADNASGNDCQVNFQDLFEFSQAMFSDPTLENWNPDADFNADDRVNFLDLSIFSNLFLSPPGPSGLSTTCSP